MRKDTEKHTSHALSLENYECRKESTIKVLHVLTPTFRIRSPIIFIASILVQGGNGWFTLLLLFPITPPTIPCPTSEKHKNKS